MSKRFGILLARQRSGTGALGTILDKHSQIKYLGEIFHPNNVGSVNNFFTYKLEAIRKEPELVLPGRGMELLEGFLGWKDGLIKNQFPIIDAKYSSLHHLCPPMLNPLERPGLLTHCIQNKLPIIHLTRNNYLHTYLSGRLAEANKVWHARSDSEIKVTSINIDVKQLIFYCNQTKASMNMMQQWLGKRHFVLEIDYADLFDENGSLATSIKEDLEDLLDVEDFKDTAPVFVKQNTAPLSEAIENFDQVSDALRKTEFGWMVET